MTTPDPSQPRVEKVVQPKDLARYTDTAQFDYFRDLINWTYNNDCNVRFDETDGTTIRFFYSYYLHIGDWLFDGQLPMTHEEVLFWLRPLADWSDTDKADTTGA